MASFNKRPLCRNEDFKLTLSGQAVYTHLFKGVVLIEMLLCSLKDVKGLLPLELKIKMKEN